MAQESRQQPRVQCEIEQGGQATEERIPNLHSDAKPEKHLKGQPSGRKRAQQREPKARQQTEASGELNDPGQKAELGESIPFELTDHVRGDEAADSITEKRRRAEKAEKCKHGQIGFAPNPELDSSPVNISKKRSRQPSEAESPALPMPCRQHLI